MLDNAHLASKRRFVITLGLMIGTAAVTIDLSLPAVPAMSEALSTTLSHGQRIIGFFMAGMAVGQIPAGLYSDRFGRLPVLYTGCGLFLVAAVVAASATDINTMLAARFFQGIGAASAIVLSRAIVRDVASGKDAAKLMALVAMIFTAAPVIAPSIGAALMAVWGWRSPFIAVVIFAILMMASIRLNLPETHTPRSAGRAWQQLKDSFRVFFSERQSVFGLLFIILPPIAFMSVITTSSSMMVETYGLSLQTFGFLFAGFGISILLGTTVSRFLVARLGVLTLIKLGVIAVTLAGLQAVAMAYLNDAPVLWYWLTICLLMFGVGLLVPNANVLALDPLPQVAGVASSIMGTLQNISSMIGALAATWIYTGEVRYSVILVAVGALMTTAAFLFKPLICPKVSVQSAPAS